MKPLETPHAYINYSFRWAETGESEYWKKLDNQWKERYRNNQLFNL